MDTNLQELREKIKGHILAIREDVKKAGFDASYLSMASFEDNRGGKYRDTAYLMNGLNTNPKKQFYIHFDFKEEET